MLPIAAEGHLEIPTRAAPIALDRPIVSKIPVKAISINHGSARQLSGPKACDQFEPVMLEIGQAGIPLQALVVMENVTGAQAIKPKAELTPFGGCAVSSDEGVDEQSVSLDPTEPTPGGVAVDPGLIAVRSRHWSGSGQLDFQPVSGFDDNLSALITGSYVAATNGTEVALPADAAAFPRNHLDNPGYWATPHSPDRAQISRESLHLSEPETAAPTFTIFGNQVDSELLAKPFVSEASHPALLTDAASLQNAQAETDAPPSQQEERTVTLSLPVLVNERQFLPIAATINSERVVAVSVTDMVRTLAEVVDEATLDRIVSLGDRSVDVQEFADLGILISLNRATLALEITVIPDLLRGTTIRASQDLTFSGVEQVLPSDFSFGLTAAAIASAPLDDGFDPRTAVGFAGFVNIGGIEGLNIDYGGNIAISNPGQGGTFQRDRITAFKDWPEKALRASGGDLVPTQARLAGAFDLIGVSLERNYEALQPIRNIRPTASRALRLDRRSIVEVYVNEVLVERFFADPGPIDITQIPLASFSNNVTIVVEDSLGRREVDSFVFGSDITLLAEGIDQFNFSLGFLRDLNTFGFNYSDTPVASAFYERGITPYLTLAAHAVVTENQQNAGGAAAFGVPVGTITADFAVSNDDQFGTGYAVGATFRGSPFFGPDLGEFATLTVDYRSSQFSTVNEFGVLEDIKFDLRADYQVNVSQASALFASANYVERHTVDGSDGFYSAGVRHNFGRLFVTLAARYADRATTGGEFGVLATITVPMGRRNSVTATYDTASNRGRAEFRRQRGLELPEVDYRIGVSTDQGGESVFGSFGFANSRFDADADVATRFGSGGTANQTVASTRFQTGIGFADGKLAFGRDPARGFTMLTRHPSISDATLTARTSAAGRELGIANDFGPGLFAVNAPFRPQQIAVEARDIPVGYNIGAGRYLLESGARSGLVIEVGSDNYRTVVTTLLFNSEPISLEYGRYRRLGDEDALATTFFTNRAGRAAFSDLAPGEYLIEFPERQIAGRFVVSEDAEALIRIDAVKLERQ